MVHSAAFQPAVGQAAVLLVAAAVAGIVTNAPRGSKVTSLQRLRPLVESPYWEYPVGSAQQEVARTQLAAAEAARAGNKTRARYLLIGIILEIAGIASTMAAVIALIAKG